MKAMILATLAIVSMLAVLLVVPSKIESLVVQAEKTKSVRVTQPLDLPTDNFIDPLRGNIPIATTNHAPRLYRETDGTLVPRNYVAQPPLIPHRIDGYEISRRQNKCLICHSWNTYQEWGATKVSLTHFQDRDGRQLDDVSPLRYFCTQCHVPQRDTHPLVRNEFQPVEALRVR